MVRRLKSTTAAATSAGRASSHRKRAHAAHALGDQGEEAVARWYQQAGYSVIDRNWRCFEGEIDLIVRRGRTTVICEVKTRTSGSFMDPTLSISKSKQQKVRTAAYRWLDEHRCKGKIRFDVALVVGGEVTVIEGAF